MTGFVVVNPEVLIARALERGGRFAPGLDFVKWRLAELSAEVRDDAEFWGIPATDIARSRAAQLAAARGASAERDDRDARNPLITQRRSDAARNLADDGPR